MGREERSTDRVETEPSKVRVPLGVRRAKLTHDVRIPEGKVGRWINDDPGRVSAARDGSYEFVTDTEAKVGSGPTNERDNTSAHVRRLVGSFKDGSPKYGYLMVIDKELYDKDQQEKLDKRNQKLSAFKRGKLVDAPSGMDGDNRYGGMTITENK